MKVPLLFALALVSSVSAYASTATNTTVYGTDSVYNTGSNTVNYGSSVPLGIAILPVSTYFTFAAVSNVTNGNTGVTVDTTSGNYYSGPDGTNHSGETISTFNSLSGIDTSTSGVLTGVFVPASGPAGTAPATLDFTGSGATTFSTLSPLLDQVFYIGDGENGTQTFYIPSGAGELYLGIADACGYNGSPSCYNDNTGSFAVTATQDGGTSNVTATPEPSSLVLLGTGLVSACGVLRRRAKR